MRKKTVLITFLMTVFAVVVTLGLVEPSWAGKVADAISQIPSGHRARPYQSQCPQGYPGHTRRAPTFLVLLYSVGYLGTLELFHRAFGGIMADVGHITIFGLSGYGATFKNIIPMMNPTPAHSGRECSG